MTNPNGLMEKYFKWRLDDSPEYATIVGHHDNNDKLDDHSLGAFAKREQFLSNLLTELNALGSHDGDAGVSLFKYVPGFRLAKQYFQVRTRRVLARPPV